MMGRKRERWRESEGGGESESIESSVHGKLGKLEKLAIRSVTLPMLRCT